MGIIEMEEVKGAINEVLEQSEYNGGGIDELKARGACKGVQRGSVSQNGPSSTEYGLNTGTIDIPVSNVNMSKTYFAQRDFSLQVTCPNDGNKDITESVGGIVTDISLQSDKIVVQFQYNRPNGFYGYNPPWELATKILGEWQIIEFY